MTDAWRMVVRRHGGPEVIEREDFALPTPGPRQALIRHAAIGVNFIDTYHRSGLYALPLPSGLGIEASGMVEAVGAEVSEVAPGQRVAYVAMPPGAYASHGLVDADRLFALPDTIADDVAAAMPLKGLTAWMLIERCAKVEPGQNILVHAAAGGVGTILVQWLKAIGATVIAHTGTAEKAGGVKMLGADHVLSCPFDTLADEVRGLTGKGVDAVLDGVGAASWAASLASLAKRGMLVSYGNASGPAPSFSALDLLRAGSVFVTRPTIFDYIDTPEERAQAARRLFAMLGSGAVTIQIGQHFPLVEAAQAHRALEARATIGATVLIP